MKGSFEKRRYLDAKTGGKRRVTMRTVTYDEPTSPGEPRSAVRPGLRRAKMPTPGSAASGSTSVAQGSDDKTTVAGYVTIARRGIRDGL